MTTHVRENRWKSFSFIAAKIYTLLETKKELQSSN